ncbi:MAG: hypothetical protein ACLR7D_11335 [Lachnospira eligens]
MLISRSLHKSNEKAVGGNFATGIAWVVGCSFMITPYFDSRQYLKNG